MACSLLHMIEQPMASPYSDPDLKDLVGDMPRLFCAASQPACELRPGESVRCFDRDAPCWKTPAGGPLG